MSQQNKLPLVGFTVGDINGIGIELILKTFSNLAMFEQCTPVVYGSAGLFNFYKKLIPECSNTNITSIQNIKSINPKQINVINCWNEQVPITPGEINNIGGKYAATSLLMATQALKDGVIDTLVTAPIDKSNIKNEHFNFVGHTPFFKNFFQANEVLMLMVSDNLKICLVTEHLPLKDIATHITKENILKKIHLLNTSLKEDFLIERPRIAVLSLNPHNGDNGLTGHEEINAIIPAIKQVNIEKVFAFGPYSADAFFARNDYKHFDAVLAMYHDQGLIPFKSLSIGEGVNYTAGLNVVRTSPDHGTAFNIAGKNKAHEGSFRKAIFQSIDIYNNKINYKEANKNPLKNNRSNENIIEDEVVENIKEE